MTSITALETHLHRIERYVNDMQEAIHRSGSAYLQTWYKSDVQHLQRMVEELNNKHPNRKQETV